MSCRSQNRKKGFCEEGEGGQRLIAGVFFAMRWNTVWQSEPIKEHRAVTCRLGRWKQVCSINTVTAPLYCYPPEKPRVFINIPPFFSLRKGRGVVDTKLHCAPLRVWVTLQSCLWWGGSKLGQGPLNRLKRPKLITQAWAMLDKMRNHRVLWMSERRTGHHLLWG